MPISKKDELRVRLSDKRVKAWKEAMLLPPKKRDNCKGIAFANGQEKPVVSYPDKDTIESDSVGHMRSSSDKLLRGFRRNGDNFSDYADPILISPRCITKESIPSRKRVKGGKRDISNVVIIRK